MLVSTNHISALALSADILYGGLLNTQLLVCILVHYCEFSPQKQNDCHDTANVSLHTSETVFESTIEVD